MSYDFYQFVSFFVVEKSTAEFIIFSILFNVSFSCYYYFHFGCSIADFNCSISLATDPDSHFDDHLFIDCYFSAFPILQLMHLSFSSLIFL